MRCGDMNFPLTKRVSIASFPPKRYREIETDTKYEQLIKQDTNEIEKDKKKIKKDNKR